MTGSLERMAERSRPLACMGDLGMTTRKPGVWVKRASGDCVWYLQRVSNGYKAELGSLTARRGQHFRMAYGSPSHHNLRL
jgi:hypothetical protein